MGQSVVRKVLVSAVVAAVILSTLILFSPRVQAATWTLDTDADFNQGTLQGAQIIGTGTAAYVRLLNDTVDWKQEFPATNPGAREGAAMAYDSVNKVVVLFGGYNGANLGDTWEYNPATNAWAQVFPALSPSAREMAGMTFDSTNSRMVLFGGVSDSGNERDTWEYNAATDTWQQTTPTPSPREMATNSLAFVSSQGLVLLEAQSLFSYNMETWAYDAAANTWTQRFPSIHPTTRSGSAVAYAPSINRVVLYGGFNSSAPPGVTLEDTWEYDWTANIWTQTATTGASPRTSAGMTYRSSANAVFLFGGRSGATFYTDTWRYPDAGGNRMWQSVSTQRAPPGRVLFGVCEETSLLKSFVYGGRLAGGGYDAQTWSMGPAYRGTGQFESARFDSGGANVNWNTISWVGTWPAPSILRFQIATSNNPAGPWDFYGPGGLGNTYYTTSPSTIYTGHDNQRYLKVRAYLLTTDDLVTSTMDSVTIDYTVNPSNPYIIYTDPYNMELQVPTDRQIFIRFSESVNPSSLTYTISPTLATIEQWSESNSAVTLNHSAAMQQCKVYTVTVTAVLDLSGNPLIGGPVPNPFIFSTICVPPEIVATTPAHGDVDVPLTRSIVVDFSEPMDKATVAANINPFIPLTPGWSNGDTTVTYTHTTDFTQCLDYTVNITGKDLDGTDLIPGMVPNPFSFRVVCTTPYIVSTDPFSLEIDVPTAQNIVVTFSEPMNTASVVPNISPPISLTPAWSNGDKTVTYSHSPFPTCTAYTVNMTGRDLSGENLWVGKYDGFADNPWTFVTTCVNPYIVFTVPADGATNVDRLADIIVQFSKAMDNTSVTATISPTIPLNSTWDTQNQVLTLTHTTEFVCGPNQVTITGRDSSGNSLRTVLAPNPWTFTPLCPNPVILSTDPPNGTFGVPLGKNIVVVFNEPMNPSTLIHALNPPDVTLTPAWSGGDTILYLNHTAPFLPSVTYQVYVDGADKDGYGLFPGGVPNPWVFTTVGLLPQILNTVPSNGQPNVPLDQAIIVTFSEPMDTPTVSCTTVPPVTLSPVWSGGNTIVTYSHTTPFTTSTMYTVTCVGKDLEGNDLVAGPVPNPWSFTTTGGIPPEITNTVPQDGETGVLLDQDIIVTFSEPMDTATVVCATMPPVTLSPAWSGGDTIVTYSHGTLFATFTTYTVTCVGKDLDGNDLVPGAVANPWSFTTTQGAPSPPGGLQITRVAPDIRLSWNPVTGADLYRIYESQNRFAPFPWNILGTTTSTTFDATDHHDDGLTHYYIVRAERTGTESTNSTMAVKIAKSIGYNPSTTNTYWFSLPYHSSYARASDISTELTPTRINIVAKWDPVKQSSMLWYYFRGKWRGNDFTISPGDGLYIGSVSAFSWVIVGTDGNVILSFNYNSPPKKNVNWISVPYTGTYARASDIATELGSSMITEVGLWNAATQTTVRWWWTGTGWTGTDFTFNPGDGIYIIVASNFNWQPSLVTPEVP